MPPQTTLRREIEPRWVAEYVATFFPREIVKLRTPLGSIPQSLVDEFGADKALRLYRPSRPEVDACVLKKRRIIIIEAKIFKFMDGLSKLPVYRSLIASTPELADFAGWPVDMQLLVAKKVSWVEEAAIKQGIEVVEWSPPWVTQVWEERNKYWTADALLEREKRKDTLRKLGYT